MQSATTIKFHIFHLAKGKILSQDRLTSKRWISSIALGSLLLSALAVGPASATTTFSQTDMFSVTESVSDADLIAPDAEPGLATSEEALDAPFVDEEGNLVPVDDQPEMNARAVVCTPESFADNPHISTESKPKIAVQGHGWWKKGNCSSATARVTSCLYEYYTNNKGSGYWERKNCSTKKKLKPGGGSANRVTSHNDCNDTKRVSWRNHVDVDADGQIDTTEVMRRQADVNCRVL